MSKLRKDRENLIGGAIVVLVILAVAFAAIGIIGGMTVTGPNYRNAVHTYVDQAYWTNDPVLIKENLTEAVAGMHALGLTDGMSWNLFSWDQQTSESMKAQYGQMQAIINLCDKAIAMPVNSSNYELNFVQATTQIHNTICTVATNGDSSGNWCDEVADGAYAMNMQPFYTWQAYVIAGTLAGLIAAIFIVAWLRNW